MPIGPRVLLYVGSLLAIVAGAIAVAVVLMVNQGHAEKRLTATSLPYASDLSAAALQAKGLANDERGFLMTGRAAFRDEAGRRALLARDEFAAAARHAATPAEQTAVAAASDGFDRWWAAVQQEFRTYDAGAQHSAVSTALGAHRELRKRYEVALSDATQVASRTVAAEAHSLAHDTSRSVDILLMLLGAAVLAAIALSLWIVRTVLQPVHHLVELIAQADDIRVI